MLGRSVIITDINGIIIGAPAKERIGDFHPSSIPCIKYKKMSFDDEEAARKLGVWYPGTTVPLFFNGTVIGTAAIAGEPEVVVPFTMLVKNQIESMLREKLNLPLLSSPQKKVNELVRDISRFDAKSGDQSQLIRRGAELGFDLNRPRSVVSIFFSNFRGLGLDKNPFKLSYENYADPMADEIDYSMMHSRVIEIIREVIPDPQNIIAAVCRDRFVIVRPCEAHDEEALVEDAEDFAERASAIHSKMKEASMDTIIGIGYPARNVYELPLAYRNGWDVVGMAERLGLPSGVYLFSDMLFDEMALNVRPYFSLHYLENKLSAILLESDAGELILTFQVYCESLFSKQGAAERLHLHRNTLTYRLQKIEEKLGFSMQDFHKVMALYVLLQTRKLSDIPRI